MASTQDKNINKHISLRRSVFVDKLGDHHVDYCCHQDDSAGVLLCDNIRRVLDRSSNADYTKLLCVVFFRSMNTNGPVQRLVMCRMKM